jgi:hypothetical protein
LRQYFLEFNIFDDVNCSSLWILYSKEFFCSFRYPMKITRRDFLESFFRC